MRALAETPTLGVSTIVFDDSVFQHGLHQPITYTDHRPEATADGTNDQSPITNYPRAQRAPCPMPHALCPMPFACERSEHHPGFLEEAVSAIFNTHLLFQGFEKLVKRAHLKHHLYSLPGGVVIICLSLFF